MTSERKLTIQHLLPTSLDSEKFVLGAIFADPAQFAVVGDLLTPAEFSVEKHRRIFQRMGDLYASGLHIDYITLARELETHGELQSVDGISYLIELGDCPKIYNLASYVATVREKAILRAVVLAAQDLIDRACTAGEDSSAILDDSSRVLAALRIRQGRALSARTPEEVCEAAGGINSFLSGVDGDGLPMPWKGLHWALNCLRRGQLVLVGARPGVGKTAFAWQIAEHAALNGHRALFVSAEMSDKRILQRAVIGLAQVSAQKWRAGKLSELERYHLLEAWGNIAGLEDRMLISDKPSPTVESIAAQCRYLESQGRPVELLCVDYVQIIGSAASRENRTQEVAAISRGLNDLKKLFDIPVIALCQLSREIDKGAHREPVLADLKESGQLEQDADLVAFLWPQKLTDMDNEEKQIYPVCWAVKKNRDGPLRRGILQFDRARTRFEEER